MLHSVDGSFVGKSFQRRRACRAKLLLERCGATNTKMMKYTPLPTPTVTSNEPIELSSLSVGDAAVITSVIQDSTMRRLQALGFVPGTAIRVIRRAPLGDPTEYELRGTRISLRKNEARRIRIQLSA